MAGGSQLAPFPTRSLISINEEMLVPPPVSSHAGVSWPSAASCPRDDRSSQDSHHCTAQLCWNKLLQHGSSLAWGCKWLCRGWGIKGHNLAL